MCLDIIDGMKAKKATRDIICYKIVYYNKIINRIATPYFSFPVKIGNVYKEKGRSFKTYSHFSYGNIKYTSIGKGGFHSYKRLSDAKKQAKKLSSSNDVCSIMIARCIIPKNSYYVNGISYIGFEDIKQYCSKVLKYEKIIKTL